MSAEEKKEWTPQEIAAQLRKPEGRGGEIVAENMQESNSGIYDMVLEELAEFPVHHLLEIGYGNARHFPQYWNVWPELQITAVDFSPTMHESGQAFLRENGQQHKTTFILADAVQMPIADGSVDVAVAVNTVYFWEPLQDYLNEILRVLKPGGTLLLGFRPEDTMQQLEFTSFGFHLYQSEELEGIAKSTGFETQSTSFNNYLRKAVNGETINNTDALMVLRKPER